MKFNRKTAGKGIIILNFFTIAVFLFVILKILPYESISGGRLESYEAAVRTATTSIVMMIYGIPVVAAASGLVRVKDYKKLYIGWLIFALILMAVLFFEASIIGVIVVSFGLPLIAVSAGVIEYRQFNLTSKIYLWLSFLFACLNTLGNLFGVTWFEKFIMGLVTLIQAMLYFYLARSNPRSKHRKGR
ncbi:hypothetical protein [Acetobacterium wieringae]|uniref:hypothetical protein n=1 Tax=Acetobacterium wieringae TaxID=52694 RepID=UPI0026ECC947|nr:hypothetical protein [Acetobacterium wieringae]